MDKISSCVLTAPPSLGSLALSVYISATFHPSAARIVNNNVYALSRRSCQEVFTHCQKGEARAEVKQVRAIAAVAVDSWDQVAIRREQLSDADLGQILKEIEAQ
jgi:hypothetical protein